MNLSNCRLKSTKHRERDGLIMEDIKKRYEAALEAFTDKLRPDPNVVAVIILGSMSNDVVWEKSDMDVTVLVRDVKMNIRSFCIEEDGIIINVDLMKDFDFRRMLERANGGGFVHSFNSKARVVYASDESIREFLTEHQKMGADDRVLSFFQSSSWLIGNLEKIEKWLTVKKDLRYAQLWILKTADIYANMLLLLNNQPLSREAVLKAMEYAPDEVKCVYQRPLEGMMTEEEIRGTIDFLYGFLQKHTDYLSQPVKEYMGDGAVRTVTTLTKHFGMDSHSIYHIFDFLAEQGIVCRVSETVRITPKSRMAVEEVAFMYFENS